jgi:hypothetical protein
VINREGISQLSAATIAELDSIYEARENGGRRNFDKRVIELSIQSEPVADS